MEEKLAILQLSLKLKLHEEWQISSKISATLWSMLGPYVGVRWDAVKKSLSKYLTLFQNVQLLCLKVNYKPLKIIVLRFVFDSLIIKEMGVCHFNRAYTFIRIDWWNMALVSFLQREPWRIKKRFSQVTSARDYRGVTFPFHMRAHLVNTRSVLTQIKKRGVYSAHPGKPKGLWLKV
jgi:hypothetical protein